MSKLMKMLNKPKIIAFILAVIMILPGLPSMNVSAAVSGITYYEHSFELRATLNIA